MMQCKCPAHLALTWSARTVRVQKADAVPEFQIMLEMEDKLARGLYAEWEEKATVALERALGEAPEELTVEWLVGLPDRLISGFRGWPSRATKKLCGDVLRETYSLSQQTIRKKYAGEEGYTGPLAGDKKVAKADPFSARDLAAMRYLYESQIFWLGEHLADASEEIRGAAWVELVGQKGKTAGEALRRLAESKFGIGAFASVGQAYFEAVAINAATTARVNGAILEMAEIGVEKYVFVAVMDERTTEICQHMDGKEFSVADAAARIDAMVKSGDPAAIKQLHGWQPRRFQDILAAAGVNLQMGKSISVADAAVVMDQGFAFPPLHARCRSTVDIA